MPSPGPSRYTSVQKITCFSFVQSQTILNFIKFIKKIFMFFHVYDINESYNKNMFHDKHNDNYLAI